ncbi:MAG TPA: hypothetical protein VMH41_15115 [Mycobacteriales bacterium]|nr:hypothetical protein [Mycobacteriales bacterium]
MTNQDAFTAQEWTLVLQAPTSAGVVVLTASHGGTFRETFAMSKAYVEARAEHGNSELLDAVVGSKPKMDHAHPHSPEELSATALEHVRDAIAVLSTKATPQEVEDYRRFILTLTEKVAKAHREDGQDVSPQEAAAIEQIRDALGSRP